MEDSVDPVHELLDEVASVQRDQLRRGGVVAEVRARIAAEAVRPTRRAPRLWLAVPALAACGAAAAYLLTVGHPAPLTFSVAEGDAKAPGALFAGIEAKVPVRRDALVKAYEQVGRTADDLPYTPHFESLYSRYSAAYPQSKPTRQEVWRHLLNLRKGGKLPKLGEARSHPPEIDADARQRLRDMLGADIGKRDRLPYTDRFDRLVDEFNESLEKRLSPHLVWRLVATLAK